MPWKHGKTYWAHVTLRDGSRKRCSLGTTDRATAREVERMIATLRGRRSWDLLNAVASGRLTVGELYDHWCAGDDSVAQLRAQLNDVDLNELVPAWVQWATRRAGSATVAKYERQLRVLMPASRPYLRSAFTKKAVSDALRAIPGSGSTGRRYHAAWSSFANYLLETDVMEVNPLRMIRAPRANPPKELHFSLPDVMRLVNAQPMPYRALAALREGAGVEISAAIGVRRRNVNEDDHTVHVHGSKNAWRDRLVLVDDWAWPQIMEACRAKLPDALLFPEVTYESARAEHRKAVKALELDARYTMHDARHSFAVRWMRDNANPQDIANNLGHKDATLVLRVYGKYRPTAADLRRARARVM